MEADPEEMRCLPCTGSYHADVNHRRRRAFAERLLSWGRVNRRDFPWRGERDPFRLLVAEVLLQRSRGKTVAAVYQTLFSRWPTPEALSRARVAHIEQTIRPLGLVRRAATLKALAGEISSLGRVPRSVPELISLPGVGRYAASATAAAAFGAEEPGVDSVSARVYRRYFGDPSEVEPSTDKTLWETVRQASRGSPIRELNWAVLDLAATICLPKVPRCPGCPLQTGCSRARAMSDPPSTLAMAARR